MNSKLLYDWDNIVIVPAVISNISSRKDVNILEKNKLPLFISPMDMVIDDTNSQLFKDLGYEVCLPRQITDHTDSSFMSYSLTEVRQLLLDNVELPKRILIDIANGHMQLLFDTVKDIKTSYPESEIMVGNIANPETFLEYCKIGVDYVRVGIGGGSACITSCNSAIHYPMASLIRECYQLREEYGNTHTKIIADGGFQKFADIIKAIGLGADYVMLGGIISKSLESSSTCYKEEDGEYVEIDKSDALSCMDKKLKVYKYFRGMSTKEVQKQWGSKQLKTSEGISKYNEVEYSISSWTENFSDYLKSCMSYSNIKDIKDFKGKADFRLITSEAFNRFNK